MPDSSLNNGAENNGHREMRGWPWIAPAAPLPREFVENAAWPKISIITPSFNQGKYIEETILSVLNQGYPNLEYIVMDGGSTDNSVDIIRKYESRLSSWASEKDKGQSNAINKGMERATGDIFTWLNSDDRLAPSALFSAALAFQTARPDIVAGICQLHQGHGVIEQHLTSCSDGVLPLMDLLDVSNGWLKGQFFYQPEVFFTRDIWCRAGGRVDESLFYSMDYELWVRFAEQAAKLKVIGRPIAQYRVHENQKTFSTADYRPELERVAASYRSKHTSGDILPAAPVEKQRLKIVCLNDIGFRYGAGIAHKRIAQSLAQAGHSIYPLAVARDNLATDSDASKIQEKLLRRIEEIAPDAVVLGNLHGAHLHPSILKEVSRRWPSVFMLHDLWLLTGRCAYTGDCSKLFSGCDESCPTAGEYPRLNPKVISSFWETKSALLREDNLLVLASDSEWVDAQVAKKLLETGSTKPHGVVHYGFPLNDLRPRDRAFCRELLGLPQDKFLLLFSCSNISEKRKGMEHLLAAIRMLDLPDLVPVCIGYNGGKTRLDLPDFIDLGYISHWQQQALLYSAVDVFVGPSLEEAFGQVFVEAAACGTPSVGYPAGGVPQAIAHNITGLLADNVSAASLAQAITALYVDDRLRQKMSIWGRVHVENEFSYERCALQMQALLRTALAKNGVRLVPKLSLAREVVPLPPPEFVWDQGEESDAQSTQNPWLGTGKMPRRDALEQEMLHFYNQELEKYRQDKIPWVLLPKAWLARHNRNRMKRKIRRRPAQTKS